MNSMEGHSTWQGPSRSDFAVCEARCCEKHGKSFHLAGAKQKFSMESHFTLQGPSRSDFPVCVTRYCEKHGRSFHLAGAKQEWLCCL